MYLSYILLGGFLLNFAFPSFAQEWFTYSTSNMLPNNTIKGIAEDSRKIKWFATGGGGLVKFDGNTWSAFNNHNTDGALKDDYLTCIALENDRVKWLGTKIGVIRYDDQNWQYFNSQNTSGGLPASVVNCIAIEKDGTKWFGTSSGLSRYNESWTVFTKTNPAGCLPSSKITCIAIGEDQRKWIGTTMGISVYDGTTWKIFSRSNTSSFVDDNITSIVIDQSAAIWVGTASGGLMKFNGSKWENFNSTNINLPGFSDNIRSIEIAKNNTLLVTTLEGIVSYDGKEWQTVLKKESGNYITQCTLKDENNLIWVGTDSAGVWKFDGEYWENFNAVNAIPNDHVYAVVPDPEGNLWLGTNGGGVVRYDGREWKVHNQEIGLPDPHVQCLLIEARKNVYAGTLWYGLAKFDGQQWNIYNSSNSGLPNDHVTALALETEGILWIGTGGGGVTRFDGNFWKTYSASTTGGAMPDDDITSLVIEKKTKVIWIGTKTGLIRFDGENWKTFNENTGLPSQHVTFITIDNNGLKWIGTDKGLAIYDDKEFRKIMKSDISESLMEFNVRSIHIEGEVKWIGTTNGLMRFDDREWIIYNHDNTAGRLPSDVIHSITKDRAGNKWLGTSRGLVKFNSEIVVSNDRDTDGDGLIDGEDLCPTTFGVFSMRGCPDLSVENKETLNNVFSNLFFQSGEDVILKSSYHSLNDLVHLMKDKPEARLYIEGHTDDQGDAIKNLELSKRRAEAVKEYLVRKGVPTGRISTNGFGSTRPKTNNLNEEGRKINRRVEMFIIQDK